MDLDLGDARVVIPGRGVGLPDKADLAPEPGLAGRRIGAVEVPARHPFAQGRGDRRLRLAAGDGGRGQRGLPDLVEGEVVGVAEAGPVAADDPDAHPQTDGLGRLLDDVLLHVDEVIGPVLHIDLGEVAPAREGDLEDGAQVGRGQTEMIDIREN